MVQAFYHDNKDTESDFTKEHNSGIPVSLEQLESIGVFYRRVDTEDELNAIAKEREYKNRDSVKLNVETFKNDLDAFNAQMKKFYKEHYHEDEEIRYVVEGEGYFDVRDKEDRWIRTKLVPHDLLVLPLGCYHRFTLTDEAKYVKAIRLFKDEPKWEAINRDLNRDSEARQEYLRTIAA
ncbi:Acireductone dioxygenase [Suhomyces tanzawaensis NRRL Y-17324]|uniref:Acireductone dioxygenase n=1 Tax=Suhomyces tanzawaensis NRRL Y-17324 TaxID=984487 RepID=A0A1E4SPM7_9ASCO|nr:Acireductone dioxygenase [Suhomyces tanzawaensis NRRL Y-17324]ODV81342.1 Acireductone dioxygenase [Suhomyces tanzawaensis NRRL Y-17324]